MGDEIKRAVVKDETLHLVRGADVWSVKAEQGKEPNEWKMVHFANVGTSEEFIETFSGEILELVDGSLIFGEERESVKNAIATIVVEGLMPAFEHLKKIRASAATPLPELNRRQLYEDFARSLWHAYKDLFPKATLLLGFDIGFLFKQDAQFENGLTAFLSKYPPLILDVPELLRRQRAKWQQGLSSFRNDYLEHRKKEIAEFAAYYEPSQQFQRSFFVTIKSKFTHTKPHKSSLNMTQVVGSEIKRPLRQVAHLCIAPLPWRVPHPCVFCKSLP